MKRVSELRKHTTSFFALHWDTKALGSHPQWEDSFPIVSPGPYPNSNLQGCYALFADDKLWYIGVGSSRGSGKYKGEGIGTRLKHVVAVDWRNKSHDGKRIYCVKDKWKGVTHISTIGFEPGTGYLAIALEHYLLSKLSPEPIRNVCKPGSV